MGQAGVLLTVEQISFGVDTLLEFVADRATVESRRPPVPPGGHLAVRNVAGETFPNGVTFLLDLCSLRARKPAFTGIDAAIAQALIRITAGQSTSAVETNDLGIEMRWYLAEVPPQDSTLLQRDQPDTELGICWIEASRSWRLDVSICECCSPWIDPGWEPDLRKVRSILDAYARPRLILPPTGATDLREDCIALIALFADKAQCIAPQDEELPGFFRSYCDRFFRREGERRELSQAEWHGVVDRVFLRLYRGKVGTGFTMPAFPQSFRAYVARAIRGGAASARSRHRPVRTAARFPSCIDEAAARLRVSHMTIRRRMRQFGFSQWTEKAWMAVSDSVNSKKLWETVTDQLVASNLRKETARKRVQRWKKRGLTADEALRRSSPAKLERGTCAACGEERVAAGAMYGDKFLCAACFQEKMGGLPQ